MTKNNLLQKKNNLFCSAHKEKSHKKIHSEHNIREETTTQIPMSSPRVIIDLTGPGSMVVTIGDPDTPATNSPPNQSRGKKRKRHTRRSKTRKHYKTKPKRRKRRRISPTRARSTHSGDYLQFPSDDDAFEDWLTQFEDELNSDGCCSYEAESDSDSRDPDEEYDDDRGWVKKDEDLRSYHDEYIPYPDDDIDDPLPPVNPKKMKKIIRRLNEAIQFFEDPTAPIPDDYRDS